MVYRFHTKYALLSSLQMLIFMQNKLNDNKKDVFFCCLMYKAFQEEISCFFTEDSALRDLYSGDEYKLAFG